MMALPCTVSRSPSGVIISDPSHVPIGIIQEFTSTPSFNTEQAPHSPSPQPSFTPVNFRSSRRISKSRRKGSVSIAWLVPFTEKLIVAIFAHLHNVLRSHRYLFYISVNCHLYRIGKSGGGSVKYQFTGAFGSKRTVFIRVIHQGALNFRKIHSSGDSIIGHSLLLKTALYYFQLLQASITQCLDNPAVYLAFHHFLINCNSNIMNRPNTFCRYFICKRINFNFYHVRSPSVGWVGISLKVCLIPGDQSLRRLILLPHFNYITFIPAIFQFFSCLLYQVPDNGNRTTGAGGA